MDIRTFLRTVGRLLWGRNRWPQCRREGRHDERQTAAVRERQRIAQGVREFFEQNYELRYNVMKQTEEFRPRPEAGSMAGKARTIPRKARTIPRKARSISRKAVLNSEKAVPIPEREEPGRWRQLTERELRRMVVEQMEQMGVAWSIDMGLYVRSALVPPYNPVRDYLDTCGRWDGQDRIGALARTVPTCYDRWPHFFHRWLLAVVAQWLGLSADHGNALVPMLIGAQGTRKTTFCRLLLPPELREYYIDDVKLDSAEQVERMLSRMLLVNIDEYNAKTDREQAKIKRLLTERDVQTRRMRSEQYELRPRMASFIATTNEREPLCDATGSRRYLCCEVEGVIDTDRPLDYRQLYAQAVDELRRGERWHLSKDEEAEIGRHNEVYRQQSSPEAVLTAYLEPGTRRKEHFMRAVDIQAELRKHVRAADVPNIKSLTLALKRSGFQHGSYDGHRGWYAKPLDDSALRF